MYQRWEVGKNHLLSLQNLGTEWQQWVLAPKPMSEVDRGPSND